MTTFPQPPEHEGDDGIVPRGRTLVVLDQAYATESACLEVEYQGRRGFLVNDPVTVDYKPNGDL
jgi:hypothetical protein